MKKIIIAPDSFKQTMSNIEVANIIYDTLKIKYPEYQYKIMPVADGGEGSINAITFNNGVIKTIETNNANMENCIAKYAIVNGCGIIEVAEVIGFKHKHSYSSPLNTTTYGIGEIIKELIKNNIKKIYICLGGTITNDGGCGLASSLGIKFYDENNNQFIPVGKNLNKIYRIDNNDFLNEYKDIKIIGLCDVTNPLYGSNGASYVYAKQKGASNDEIEKLDQGLLHLSNIVKKDLNIDLATKTGSGAAGGLGYCVCALLNGKLKKGIQTILDIIQFKEQLDENSVVITGEGKLDDQSFQGKVIDGILNITNKKKIPTIVVTGKIEGNNEAFLKKGIYKIALTNPNNLSFDIVKRECHKQLIDAIKLLEI